MAIETVTIIGKYIKDKHTHYEAYPSVGPVRATIMITGEIAGDFQKMYGYPITDCKSFTAEVNLRRNDQRIEECQDVFQSPSHPVGRIDSLDDVVVSPSQKSLNFGVV